MSRLSKLWEKWSQPIDWAALAADRPGSMRKGDRHKVETVELLRRKANERVRRRGQDAWRRMQIERRRPPTNASLFWNKHRIALAMAPGQWYGQPDIIAASGINRDSARVILARMRRKGELERARNPEHRPKVYVRGVPVHLQAAREPEWLYRLTALGEALRREASWLK